MTKRPVQNVDVDRGGGSFRFPGRDFGTSSVYHATYRLWAVPVLAVKLTDQGRKYCFSPVKLESDNIFVARLCVTL